jgi:hypothetical protein
MVAIFRIAGNPDSGAVDGYPHCGGSRISARANSRRAILHRSEEYGFRAPYGRRARRRMSVLRGAHRMWLCQPIEMVKLPKRDMGHRKKWVIRKTYRSDQLSQFYLIGCVA